MPFLRQCGLANCPTSLALLKKTGKQILVIFHRRRLYFLWASFFFLSIDCSPAALRHFFCQVLQDYSLTCTLFLYYNLKTIGAMWLILIALNSLEPPLSIDIQNSYVINNENHEKCKLRVTAVQTEISETWKKKSKF